MTLMRSIRRAPGLINPTLLAALALCPWGGGCAHKEPVYGTERSLASPMTRRQVWAIAPAINLAGQRAIDPLLQADLLYQQLQQVRGLTIVPVNRVAEVYASLKVERVQSEAQAYLVCDLLGVDGLVVPTITSYDPYNPPKMGASLQVFLKPPDFARQAALSPRDVARAATPPKLESLPPDGGFVQAVGMFDAANGSVREAVYQYATGRNDPVGPYGAREYLVSMDRYSGFVYWALISDLMNSPKLVRR